jgi:hypothetical protein
VVAALGGGDSVAVGQTSGRGLRQSGRRGARCSSGAHGSGRGVEGWLEMAVGDEVLTVDAAPTRLHRQRFTAPWHMRRGGNGAEERCSETRRVEEESKKALPSRRCLTGDKGRRTWPAAYGGASGQNRG